MREQPRVLRGDSEAAGGLLVRLRAVRLGAERAAGRPQAGGRRYGCANVMGPGPATNVWYRLLTSSVMRESAVGSMSRDSQREAGAMHQY